MFSGTIIWSYLIMDYLYTGSIGKDFSAHVSITDYLPDIKIISGYVKLNNDTVAQQS